MSLIDRMTTVYDRVYPISDRLGVKQHVSFTYTDRMTSVVTSVTPRPRAGNPPAHKLMMWQQQNVEVNNGDLYITGVSRTYNGILQGAVCTIDGKAHTILWIDKEQSVTYSLLVRPERSR